MDKTVLSDKEWVALAERHSTNDWNSDRPDGYLNAVKALCQDFSSIQPAASEAGAVPPAMEYPPMYPDESREDQALAHRYRQGWNACREAMLTGAPPSAPAAEPVACLVRYRNLTTPASIAFDRENHFGEWGEWKPETLSYGRAVTDSLRNTPELYQMRLLIDATAPSAESAERALLRRALNWMMTSKDRPNMLASLIHEALHGEPAYFALSAGAQGEIARAQRAAAATAPAQLSGNSGELDAQGDERAQPSRSDVFLMVWNQQVALVGLKEDDRPLYRAFFNHAWNAAQAELRRADLSRQPSAPASAEWSSDDPDLMMALAGEFRQHPQTKAVIGREALILRCVRAALAAAKPEGGE